MKTAVVQEPPVYLDLAASMERAVGLIEKAAAEGAKLIVFPEAWFPGYPTFVWRLPPGAGMGKTDELFTRMQANSIDLSRGGMTPLQDAAREHEMVIVAGYQELDGAVSGSTLYNSCVIIDADGTIANNHRKLMPTNPERMVWGFGDGSGLKVVDTAVGPDRCADLLGKTTCPWRVSRCMPKTSTSMSRHMGQRRHMAGHNAAHRARRRLLGDRLCDGA